VAVDRQEPMVLQH